MFEDETVRDLGEFFVHWSEENVRALTNAIFGGKKGFKHLQYWLVVQVSLNGGLEADCDLIIIVR